jgi:hypothetical protein
LLQLALHPHVKAGDLRMHPGSQHRLQLRGHVPSSGGLCAVEKQAGRQGWGDSRWSSFAVYEQVR